MYVFICIYVILLIGVYKCGFATTQSAYDEAINQLYEGLDKVESILSNQRLYYINLFYSLISLHTRTLHFKLFLYSQIKYYIYFLKL